jgi:hypothetical protein
MIWPVVVFTLVVLQGYGYNKLETKYKKEVAKVYKCKNQKSQKK